MIDNEIKNAVIVFLRYPIPGKVKTRLAAKIGNKLASLFYEACTAHTLQQVTNLLQKGYKIFLFGSEENEIKKIETWTNSKFAYYVQEGDNLGSRMLNAFKKIFLFGFTNVVIIGTDAPGITLNLVNNAFKSLAGNDCVIGPADDGGYYLLGFKNTVLDLFSGMQWSTPDVFDRTINKINQLNAKVHTLEKLIDVDTSDDLVNWYADSKANNDHPIVKFTTQNLSKFL